MLTVLHGDAMVKLREIPAESVHLVVTSPPYWGLRDYGIPPTVWGGRADCGHEWQTITGTRNGENRRENSDSQGKHAYAGDSIKGTQAHLGQSCRHCGAWLGNLGLEPTPELYVEHMVALFEEVRRVLRKDGTLWVNLGDSYHTGTSGAGRQGTQNTARVGRTHTQPNLKAGLPIAGLKPGDLCMMPARVALALQAAGWWLRKDNIWFKPNPMPESVNGWRWVRCRRKLASQRTQEQGFAKAGGHRDKSHGNLNDQPSARYEDCLGCAKCEGNGGLILRRASWRCTTAHEYFFQFSKSQKYFCDAEAAKERSSGTAHPRGNGVNPKAEGREFKTKQNNSFSAEVTGLVSSRNRRSVWRVNTRPFKGAHFATFPPDLVRPIILAATPTQCCSGCGAPWAPVVVAVDPGRAQKMPDGWAVGLGSHGSILANGRLKGEAGVPVMENRVLGHRATCRCNLPGVPARVLDPFGGSGTVGQVCVEEGREAILIELNADYLPLIERRAEAARAKLNAPARKARKPARVEPEQWELFATGQPPSPSGTTACQGGRGA